MHMADKKARPDEARKPYTAPKLKVYGDALKLTASGSGTVNESSNKLPRP